jgi:hypothetical protein
MSKKQPIVMKLTLSCVERNDSFYHYISSLPGRTGKQVSELVPLFDFKNDERYFARELLETKNNFWLFRCNQRKFCGDFLAVDMSSNDIRFRDTYVIDLKQNAPLKTNGGGAGNQFINSGEACDWIAEEYHIIDSRVNIRKLSGDKSCILNYL